MQCYIYCVVLTLHVILCKPTSLGTLSLPVCRYIPDLIHTSPLYVPIPSKYIHIQQRRNHTLTSSSSPPRLRLIPATSASFPHGVPVPTWAYSAGMRYCHARGVASIYFAPLLLGRATVHTYIRISPVSLFPFPIFPLSRFFLFYP